MISLAVLSSCDSFDRESYCRSLISRVKKPEVQAYIRSWINENIISKPIETQKIKNHTSRYYIGSMIYDVPFNWDVLGFNRLPEIIFIDPIWSRNYPRFVDISKFRFENIESIYFAQMSRIGVAFDINTKGDFGFGRDEMYVTKVSEDIGVRCVIPI